MKATDMLKEDHRVVDALFKKAEETTPSKQVPIYKRIQNELLTHAHIEETVFYPKLRRHGNKELVDITLEGIEEHGQIRKFLNELGKLTAKSEKFTPKLTVLIEDTRHHVKEEENDMFPMVEKQFSSDQLEKLGDDMQREKVRFQKANGIPARSAADAAAGKGFLATMVDKVAAVFSPAEPQKRSNGKDGGAKKPGGKSPAAGGKTSSSKSASKQPTGSSKSSSKGGSSTGKGSSRSAAAK